MINEQGQHTFGIIKEYKGFTITESKYIEEIHPQYNYLAFAAKNNIGQKIEAVFHDIDMRIMTYNELLNLFLKRVDYFIRKLIMNKICTSKEQSQRLVELGIDINTADMSYATWTILVNGEYILSPNQGKTIEELQEDYGSQIIPAWSLTALLKVIPKRIKDSNVLRIDISEEDFSIWYDDVGCGVNTKLPDITMEYPVDACYEMIVKLKEKNLL